MEKTSKKLMQDIAKTRNIIRKKHLVLRLGKRESDGEITKKADPITQPLNELVNKVKSIKREDENENIDEDSKKFEKSISPTTSAFRIPIQVKKLKYQTKKRRIGDISHI